MKPSLKLKKCKVCKAEFMPWSTLQRCCGKIECAVTLVRGEAEADKRRWAREEKRKLREAKANLKTLVQWCKEVQRDVNRYVMARARIDGRVCISCGSPDISDAGHFIHAGSKYRTNRLRFDLRVLEPQCQHCNRFAGGGNGNAYRDGLMLRYGQERLDEIADLKRQADSGELLPLSKEEVREIGKQYRALTRQLLKAAA